MPRWAEGVGLVLVSVVLIGAILVYAKFTTQKNSKVAAAQKDETSTLLDAASSIPDIPAIEPSPRPRRVKPRPARKPPKPALARPAATQPAPRPRRVVFFGPPLAASNLNRRPLAEAFRDISDELFVGPPVAGKGGRVLTTADKRGAAEAAGATEEELKKKSPSVGPAAVLAGSQQELALIEAAHETLVMLHNLRLRPDVARANSDAAVKKLDGIISRLPPDTAKKLRAQIDRGYNARVRDQKRSGGPGDNEAEAVGVRERTAGRYDDTPSDVRALDRRARILRRRYGGRARSSQSVRPQVNPRALPSAGVSSLRSRSGGAGAARAGGLPEAKASNL